MSEATIYQAVRSLVMAGQSPESAAASALDGMTKEQLIQFVLPEVERLARSFERGRVRRVERAAFAGPTRPDAVGRLVAESFMLPDGRLVSWGSATADDHIARAAWQRSNAADVIADAQRHELAAKLISDAGVLCLNDLGLTSLPEVAA